MPPRPPRSAASPTPNSHVRGDAFSIADHRASRRGRRGPAAPLLAAALALMTSAYAGIGRADADADRRLAQSLFDRGRRMLEAGRYSEACPLFAESHRLDPAGGTLLNLAVCHEQQGLLATAHAEFHEALSQAIRDGRSDRRTIAEERIDALTPRLSTITLLVTLEAEIPGLEVRLDGAVVARAAWGTPTAVDGGTHRVDAVAPGRQGWVKQVEVAAANDRRTLQVPVLPPWPSTTLPGAVCPAGLVPRSGRCEPMEPGLVPPASKGVLGPAGAGATSGAGARFPAGVPAGALGRPDGPPVERRFSKATWLLGGVSLGVVAAGAVTGTLALTVQHSANDAADKAGCLPDRAFCRDAAIAQDAASGYGRANALAWISTVSFAAGTVGALVALVLPRDRRPVKSSTTISLSATGLAVRGSFH